MDPEVVVVGIGPGPIELLTREAQEILLETPKVFFRISAHPVYSWLEEQGKALFCFDVAYTIPGMGRKDLYEFIAQAVLKEAKLRGRAVYALPGNPFVFERTAQIIERDACKEDVAVRVIPGMSFLELIYTELRIDPAIGLQIVTPGALDPSRDEYSEHLGLLVGLIGHSTSPDPNPNDANIDIVGRWLTRKYPQDHPVSLIWTDGMPNYETESATFELRKLSRYGSQACFASLYVPPLKRPS